MVVESDTQCGHCPIEHLCSKPEQPSLLHIRFLLDVLTAHHVGLEEHLNEVNCRLHLLYEEYREQLTEENSHTLRS